MFYMCPVCGFPELKEPAYDPSGGGSFDICESCGYQFGITDDDLDITHEEWRNRWIKKGMPWSSSGIKQPQNWNPKAQLRRIGVIVE